MTFDHDPVGMRRLQQHFEHPRMENQIGIHINESIPDELAREPERIAAARGGVVGILDERHGDGEVRPDLVALMAKHDDDIGDAALSQGSQLVL